MIAGLLFLAAVQSQTPPAIIAPAPAATAGAQSADPARVAAARPVIDQVWPLGTYARLMRGMAEQMSSGMLAGMYGMRPEDMLPAAEMPAGKRDGKTFGQIMAETDPYFQQRTDITMRVMFDEMGKLMTEVEPEVRAALVQSYARRFSVQQLADLQRFFATPTGIAYAADSMMLMMGPEMMKAMQAFTPRLMKAMPAIFVKVQDATKHLPPPPKKKETGK
ncbi:DUF2059 domain-containing protein [Sphingomonas aracearum]|uniref:DUF2059 domain-containing protein n=1 Tax=Sphingomonas aracearum TaxID=2283317 RepID=A0A369VWE4_9SPHN|nr:DUF2059 domain-containing protein [Sphingomonas aracearum]RDE05955.1 DUF2059 domain-containing protein [Sphingomonas aracearum]